MSDSRVPRLSAVAYAQLDLLLRVKFVIGLLGVVILEVLMIYGVLRPTVPPWEGPTTSMLYIMLLGLGGMAGGVVWFQEGIRNRRYHWSMPVRREIHDMLRIAAGAAWLVALIALTCVIAWFAEGAEMREQWLRHAGAYWAGLFLIPLLMYLLVCIPCMSSGRPLMMILLVLTATITLSLEPIQQRFPRIADMGRIITAEDEPFSLSAALGGGAMTAPWSYHSEQVRVFKAVRAKYFADEHLSADAQKRVEDNVLAPTRQPPLTQRTWLMSLGTWYAIAFLGIALALRRRPDV